MSTDHVVKILFRNGRTMTSAAPSKLVNKYKVGARASLDDDKTKKKSG